MYENISFFNKIIKEYSPPPITDMSAMNVSFFFLMVSLSLATLTVRYMYIYGINRLFNLLIKCGAFIVFNTYYNSLNDFLSDLVLCNFY